MSEKVLLIVMDGIGFSKTGIGDAVTLANTPVLDRLLKECPNVRLKAHGDAVGLPSDDDMGNSEVGHNALGCGQIYSQVQNLLMNQLNQAKSTLQLLGVRLKIIVFLTIAHFILSVFFQTVMFTQIFLILSLC